MKPYREVLAEKNRLIDNYRRATSYADDLRRLRDNIDEKKNEALGTLNDILLNSFVNLGIKFEEATWDDAKKRALGEIKSGTRLLLELEIKVLLSRAIFSTDPQEGYRLIGEVQHEISGRDLPVLRESYEKSTGTNRGRVVGELFRTIGQAVAEFIRNPRPTGKMVGWPGVNTKRRKRGQGR